MSEQNQTTFPKTSPASLNSEGKAVIERYSYRFKIWFVLTLLGAVWFVLEEWPRGKPRPLIIVSLILVWIIVARYRNAIRERLHLKKTGGAALCILIGWAVGMAIEISITGTTGKPGGLAGDTMSSFLLAQGLYWTYPLIALLLIRRFHFTYWEVFFAAGLTSIIEMVVLGIFSILLSPLIFLFPFVFAFYIAVYGAMISIPLLFVDEKVFWDNKFTPVSRAKAFVITFFILGVGNWLIFGVWSLLLKTLGVDISGAI